MKKVKVSVIIPSYNHWNFIGKTIESVLTQSFEDFELIILDDCSTDSSVELISCIKDNRIKTIFLEQNIGTVGALNQLMSQCKGEYIATLGSDDIWYKDKLEKQVSYLEAHQHVGACFSWAKIIDENDCAYDLNAPMNIEVFNEKNKTQGEWFRLFFDDGNHLCHSSSVIRTSVVREIGNYKLGYRQLHDLDYWIRLINKYPIYVIEEELVGYRRATDSSESVSGATKANSLRLLNESYCIIESMVETMEDKHILEGFGNLFIKKNAHSLEEIICEKFFILLNYTIWENKNEKLAVQFIMNKIENPLVIECLFNKYNYSLKDFYKQTGKYFSLYPKTLSDDLIMLENKIEEKTNESHQLQQENSQLQQENSQLTQSAQQLQQEKDRLQHELNRQQISHNETLETIYHSTSWKISKPLRTIKSMMKGIK